MHKEPVLTIWETATGDYLVITIYAMVDIGDNLQTEPE